jgi:hypothetical protein
VCLGLIRGVWAEEGMGEGGHVPNPMLSSPTDDIRCWREDGVMRSEPPLECGARFGDRIGVCGCFHFRTHKKIVHASPIINGFSDVSRELPTRSDAVSSQIAMASSFAGVTCGGAMVRQAAGRRRRVSLSGSCALQLIPTRQQRITVVRDPFFCSTEKKTTPEKAIRAADFCWGPETVRLCFQPLFPRSWERLKWNMWWLN